MNSSSKQVIHPYSPEKKGTHRVGVLAANAESALELCVKLEAQGSFSFETLKSPLEPSMLIGLDALILEDVFPHLDALAVLENLPPGTVPVLVLGVHDLERSSRLLKAGIQALLSPEDTTLEQTLRRVIREVKLEREVERAELERTFGEQRLRLALESGRMGLWDWNTVTGHIEADARTLELFGLTPESFDGEVDTLFAGIHPQDLPGVMAVVNEALQNETPYRSDYHILVPEENGAASSLASNESAEPAESSESVRWIRSQGHPYRRDTALCVVGFVEDISAEVKTRLDLERMSLERNSLLERRLNTSEDRLAKLLGTLPVVVFALDAEGHFTLSEGQALQKLGLKPGEVVGQSALELYRDYPVLTRSLEAALSGQNLTVDHTLGESTFENHYTAVQGPSGGVEGVFGIAFDVTENRRLERERRAAQDTSEVLSLLSDALTLTRTPQAAARLALDKLGPLLKLETALIARRRGEFLHTLEFWGPRLPQEDAVLAAPIPLALTPGASRMFESGQALYVEHFGSLSPQAPGAIHDRAVGYEPIRFSSGEAVGMLSVRRVRPQGIADAEPSSWSSQERELLRRAAATLGLALERAEREAALEAASARSELLAALADVLFVQSSSRGVFEVASEHLAGVLNLDYTCLMRPEARAGTEVLKLFHLWGTMPPSALNGSTRGFARSGGGMTWTALSRGEGVYAADYQSAPGRLDLELPGLAVGVEPVRGADGAVRATLSVGRSSAQGEWTSEERDLLARVARTVGLALERTEREAALEESRAQAELLAHLSDSLQSAQTPDTVARRAMERLCVVLNAQTMLFVQLEGDFLRPPLICGELPVQTRPFVNTAQVSLSSAPILSRVMQSGKALYLDDEPLEPDPLAHFPGLASAVVPVCKPLGELEGMLIVWREPSEGGWKLNERDLLRRTASTVGVALERSQFVESLQERFDFVLESAGLGLWDWNIVSGVQHWSPEQEKLFGLEPGGFDGTYAAYCALIHPDDLERTERRAEAQLDPQGPDEFEHEFRIVHPHGVRWLYGRGRIERGEGGKPLRMSGVNFDITERKAQQQALERTLERFARAQSASKSWVFEWNLLSGAVERSSGVEEVLGYGPHELKKSLDGWLAIIHPDDLALGQQAVATALEQGGPYSAEYRVRHKAGHYLAVWERGEIQTDASGRPTLLVASTMDITQQRATLQALRESEEFASSVLESSPDCIKVLDLAGRVLQMNNPGQAVMEIDDFESVRDCPWKSLWPLEMKAVIEDTVQQAVSGQTVHFQGQSATLKGTLKWWDVVVAPVRGAGGEVQRLVSVSRDMTAQREVFQSLVEREAELREAHDSQRRFVNDLAHELRTPLTAISGNLELMLRYPQMTLQDRVEAVGEALSESQRLGRLATDLLALARGDAGVELEMSELELKPILLEVWKETGRLARGHTLELGVLEPLEVEGHRDRLKQLALILLDNALKYTPAPGRVALELVRDGDSALLKVSDGGPGIPEADLPRVFERFYRVRRPAQGSESDPGGTGLGLPIAQLIATQHGGSIWLESELGRGTTVFVRLPLLESQALEDEPLSMPLAIQ